MAAHDERAFGVRAPDRIEVSAGEVTFNAMPDAESIKVRQATPANGTNKGFVIYTEPLSEGNDPVCNGNIATDEIVFMQRRDTVARQNNGGALARYKPLILSSFNLMTTNTKTIDYPAEPLSEDKRREWDDLMRERLFTQIVPAGSVSEPFTFDEASQKKNGLAPAVRVSKSLVNTGTQPLRAGSLLSVRVPPIDPVVREAYLKERNATNIRANGVPPRKLLFVTEEFDPRAAAWTAFRAALVSASQTDMRTYGTSPDKASAIVVIVPFAARVPVTASAVLPSTSLSGAADAATTATTATTVEPSPLFAATGAGGSVNIPVQATPENEALRIETLRRYIVYGEAPAGQEDTFKAIRKDIENMIKATAAIYYAASAHVIGRIDSDAPPGRKFQATCYF